MIYRERHIDAPQTHPVRAAQERILVKVAWTRRQSWELVSKYHSSDVAKPTRYKKRRLLNIQMRPPVKHLEVENYGHPCIYGELQSLNFNELLNVGAKKKRFRKLRPFLNYGEVFLGWGLILGLPLVFVVVGASLFFTPFFLRVGNLLISTVLRLHNDRKYGTTTPSKH